MFADNFQQASRHHKSIPSNKVELHAVDNNANQMKNNLGKVIKWKYLLVVMMFTFHLWSPVTSVVTQDSINGNLV